MDRRKLLNIFPAINTLGYYDSMSQIINLNSITREQFSKAKSGAHIDEQSAKVLGLYAHEITHWLDHISTLWGQKRLVLLFNALNAYATSSIDEFWRVKLYCDTCITDDRLKYYQQIYHNASEKSYDRWQVKISVGSTFDVYGKVNHNAPIVIARFNYSNGTEIARSPLTIASILESKAIAREFYVRTQATKEIQDIVNRESAKRAIQEDSLKVMHNPQMVLYNVAFNTIAWRSNLIELDKIFNYAELLGNIVLNFPEASYAKAIRYSVKNTEIDQIYAKLFSNRDLGFLFLSLIENGKTLMGGDKVDLERILLASGIDNIDEMVNFINQEMEQLQSKLIDGPFKQFGYEMLERGTEVFNLKGIGGNLEKALERLNSIIIPRVMFGDSYFDTDSFDATSLLDALDQGDNLSFEEYFHLIDVLKDKFEEFVSACS